MNGGSGFLVPRKNEINDRNVNCAHVEISIYRVSGQSVTFCMPKLIESGYILTIGVIFWL